MIISANFIILCWVLTTHLACPDIWFLHSVDGRSCSATKGLAQVAVTRKYFCYFSHRNSGIVDKECYNCFASYRSNWHRFCHEACGPAGAHWTDSSFTASQAFTVDSRISQWPVLALTMAAHRPAWSVPLVLIVPHLSKIVSCLKTRESSSNLGAE